MNTYLCELVNKGIVKERFYRNGDSVEAILEGLELFYWSKGKWEIIEVN